VPDSAGSGAALPGTAGAIWLTENKLQRCGVRLMLWVRSTAMASADPLETRLSLLIRLTRPGPIDERAWREFVDHYAPVIFRWCQRNGLQETDAEDVTQQVMLKLATHLPAFSYDPTKSFRAWLRTLTHHAWVDFLADRSHRGSGDTGVWKVLASVESRDELLKRIEEEFDLELVEIAVARVRERVDPGTWDAFRMTAIDGLPAAQVARALGKKVATVYVARQNVQRMLRAELAACERSR
jgi:RNA polymerase sigma-70 factor (ECF subfamily)